MRQVNEHLAKISASQIALSQGLELGEEVTLIVTGDVTKIEQRDNQDGTYDQVYIVKGIIVDVENELLS